MDGFPNIGEKLAGRFRIVFGRGSGPTGVVYKALDLALDLPVAVKIFRPEFFSSAFREQNLLRLYRARAYKDPNLVTIYEVMEDRGTYFITAQLMEGMSLDSVEELHAESGELFTVSKIRAFLTRILNGLQVIHKSGAIHGNLKPQNIFVLPDKLMLADPYYIVERVLQEGEEIPLSDYYRGPEQLTDPSLEMRETDIYALALIIGEVITGNPVKPGIPLSLQMPRLTGRFDGLFLKATDPDPYQRPHSLEEFGDKLMEAISKVETEGLWMRRYHETGSFKAIKISKPIEPTREVEPSTTSFEPEKVKPVEAKPSQDIRTTVPTDSVSQYTPPTISTTTPKMPETIPSQTQISQVAPPVRPTEPVPEEKPPVVQPVVTVQPKVERAEEVKIAQKPISYIQERAQMETSLTQTPVVEKVEPPVARPHMEEIEEVSQAEVEEVTEREGIEFAKSTEDELLETIDIVHEHQIPEAPQIAISPPIPPESVDEDDIYEAQTVEMPPEMAREEIREALKHVSTTEQPQRKEIPDSRDTSKSHVHFWPTAPSSIPDKVYVRPDSIAQEEVRPERPPSKPIIERLNTRTSTEQAEVGAVVIPKIQEKVPQKKKEAGPLMVFFSLFFLFVVVGGAGMLIYVRLSEGDATTEKPKDLGIVATQDVERVKDVAKETTVSIIEDVPTTVASIKPPPPPPPPPPPKKTTFADLLSCPQGMVKIVIDPNAQEGTDPSKVAYCIDAYEYPGKGKKPKTGVSSSSARALCKEVGKRLCTAEEFMRACGETYPYGEEFDPDACNVSGKIVETGSFSGCKTKEGVYDLVGNASEWTADGLIRGGDATQGKGATCSSKTKRFLPGPTNGFRCCTEAKR